MKHLGCIVGLWVGLMPTLAVAQSEAQAPGTRRLSLIVGCDDGGPTLGKLRYAASDATAVAHVMQSVGGVLPQDMIVLRNPRRQALDEALAAVSRRLLAEQKQTQRTEFVFYYSGHSDEEGLLLFGERMSYQELRQGFGRIPADVSVAVLDSCASGAFTRSKGGTYRPPFLLDQAANTKGQAFLTSSSKSEVAQESDRLRSSYFTHYLLSGLRGGADTNADGRVTLNEAYQYAFSETLAKTEKTMGGAQHPAYEFNLSGSGDLVLTDLRLTRAGLLLPGAFSGRLFIHGPQDLLVAEIRKSSDAPMRVGLDLGSYRLVWQLDKKLMQAELTLQEGELAAVDSCTWSELTPEAATMRGDEAASVAAGDSAFIETGSQRVLIPFNLSLWPALSLNARAPTQAWNYVDLNLFGSEAAELTGFSIGGGSVITRRMSGLQLSVVYNQASGLGSGAQLGGINVAHEFAGIQMAPVFNQIRQSFKGIQVAGLNFNSGPTKGLQMGLMNLVTQGAVWGVQGSFFNLSLEEVIGAQMGAVNASGDFIGVQAAGVNVAREIKGLQLGLVNVAKTLRGVQLGLVNISNEAHGLPIGLINYAKNGQLSLDLWASEMDPFNFGLRLGSRYMHTMLVGGFRALPSKFPGEVQWHWGLGFGFRIPFEPLDVRLDMLASNVRYDLLAKGGENLLGQVRVVFSWQAASHFGIFVGASLNGFYNFAAHEHPSYLQLWTRDELSTGATISRSVLKVWPGFFAGIQL